MKKYNSDGSLINTYSVNGAPNVMNGGGLTVVGNDVYIFAYNTCLHGVINGSAVNFSPIIDVPNMGADCASCPDGTYYYIVEAISKNKKILKGNITLLR